MSTFIIRLNPNGSGPSLAIKDLIDLAGQVTTAGSRAVAEGAMPADADAQCLAGARTIGARIVGKTNLFELAYGASGVNEWFGTPVNPLDPRRVPGGSSSGSAVAVATGDSMVALGTDTGGSVRIPSAFCGTVGLKTTHGRVPLGGVWPLAPSLDTVGPMARNIAGVRVGMTLIEPGFTPTPGPATVIGRVRPAGVPVDPVIDAAVDAALEASGLQVLQVTLSRWMSAYEAGADILDAEAVRSNHSLLADPARRSKLGALVAARFGRAELVTAQRVEAARVMQRQWRGDLDDIFCRVQLLAVPTVGFFPPPLADATGYRYTAATMPINLAGVPALALPVPTGRPLPASLQLVGPDGAEELLVSTGQLIEDATTQNPGFLY